MSEITRKLATVERVKEIIPHDNSDSLEIAEIRGWQVIVGKDQFKQNDLVLYFEIDSFLPVIPQFEFLRKGCFRSSADIGEGFRIRTIKLRGEISQGLLAPLSDFPEYFSGISLEEGMDVTELLGVKKWELPLSPCLKGDALGLFPSFIPKTDEERWENLTDRDYHKHSEDDFEVTVKMDGQSMTVYHNLNTPIHIGPHVGVCSRNLEIKESDESLQWKLVKTSGLAAALDNDGCNVAIQGELCGPGIQKNRMQLKEHRFFVFNIWNIDRKEYLTSDDRSKFLSILADGYECKLDHVEVIDPIMHGIPTHAQLTDIVKHNFNGQKIEGVVYKSLSDPSFSFKYINPEYLLKEKD